MQYQHRDIEGKTINLPVGKVICVGRNYAAHAKELGNEVPSEPLLFLKPNTSLCFFEDGITFPTQFGEVHFETELAVLIREPLKNIQAENVSQAVWGYGLAFDLTLRDLQNRLKEKGHPWEKAKAFDGACPVTQFVEKKLFQNDQLFALCEINQSVRQELETLNMLWSINELIAYMSRFFSLQAGDVILTGTPEGVGKLSSGDEICVSLFDSNKNLKLQSKTFVK